MPSDGPSRFGVFEVDLAARELRKRGVRVKLQDQPFRVLEALLEKPGAIVTREELKERLWVQDEFVEFETVPRVGTSSWRRLAYPQSPQ
jgi:DNA-binding response OmpR family regulator